MPVVHIDGCTGASGVLRISHPINPPPTSTPMKTAFLRQSGVSVLCYASRSSTTLRIGLWMVAILGLAVRGLADPSGRMPSRTWPQAYSVERNESKGILALRTPYYVVEQDLKKGGAIARIALTHGKATNLLVQPIETRVRDENGAVLTDLGDSSPTVSHRREGSTEIVTVESILKASDGRGPRVRVKTTLQYRWGYVKIRKELLTPAGIRVREVCPFSTILTSSLSEYGYREGTTEAEGAPPFSFNSNHWGRLRLDRPSDPEVQVRYVPRSMIFADAGVEGLEWFVGSDLWQWDLQLTGSRGRSQCVMQRSSAPAGLAVSVSPLWNADAATTLPNRCVFDFYVAVPIRDGMAQRPWLHASFNRNRGNWVSTEQVEGWAREGIQTIHCHNDGDAYGDGLFWRDGSYPPYPDMGRYDKVLTDCRKAGIRTSTYFSNKELHPSTKEFLEHGKEWGRMNRKGDLQHNAYGPNSEFGAQMCLRSGWLEFLKFSIDRVLQRHPLDGVYYDWNVALLCMNPLHEPKHDAAVPAVGHWDIDELLDLMEWTRNRVGPKGLIIIHNTTTPMYATENFADYVVATEWGYKQWKDQATLPQELPLEWSLVGAVPRGVISYGLIDSKSPRRLHRIFAMEALLSNVTPWPVSPETLALVPILQPLGDISTYRFADWRNPAVALSEERCASAVFSRPGESYLLLANLDQNPHEVTCVLHPERLPHPLARTVTATQLAAAASSAEKPPEAVNLDGAKLVGEGVRITIPGDGVLLVHVR